MTVPEAYQHCTALARAHYENFPVGLLVPAHLAPHIHAVYAFARHADDLADEGYTEAQAPTPEQRVAALDAWEQQLLAPPTAQSHPIFIALHETMREYALPVSLFTDLLSAFKQDSVKRRYANFAEVLDYCQRSANPIGRLVLLLHRETEAEQMRTSDCICTALQLANFWQDISVDILKDRIYLPMDEMQQAGVSETDLRLPQASEALRQLVKSHVDRTEALFQEGRALLPTLPGRLRWEILFTWCGGRLILQKIRAQNYDTLQHRPKVSKADLPRLIWHALCPPR